VFTPMTVVQTDDVAKGFANNQAHINQRRLHTADLGHVEWLDLLVDREIAKPGAVQLHRAEWL